MVPGTQREALYEFKEWCERNGGTAEGHIFDETPDDQAGDVKCHINSNSMTLTSTQNAFAPRSYIDDKDGEMEFRSQLDVKGMSHTNHRKIVSPKDVHMTDITEEIYIDWETFRV